MSEITPKTLRATIQDTLDLKVKFTDLEQAYALLDLLKATLPKRGKSKAPVSTTRVETEEAAPKAADKPKVKKAKVVTATEAELLAPADGVASDAADADAPTLGATDEFRGNKYRLQALAPALCVARKIDEANTIAGTRPGDEGAAGKVFPEAQCSKKPIMGGRLCATCAKKETEYLSDTSKVPKGWYGRLDEELFQKAFVVGCEWFLGKYPSGIEGARPSASAPVKAEKPKKVKPAAAAAAAAAAPPPTEDAAAPAKAEKPKKAKAPTPPPPPPPAEEEEEEEEEKKETEAEKPKKVKAAAAVEEVKPAKKPDAKKASVASSTAPKDVEWVTFFSDGVLLIRHTKTGNVYQCDQSKHRLEEMVQREKFEGKWRGGRLDPYAEEDEE